MHLVNCGYERYDFGMYIMCNFSMCLYEIHYGMCVIYTPLCVCNIYTPVCVGACMHDGLALGKAATYKDGY